MHNACLHYDMFFSLMPVASMEKIMPCRHKGYFAFRVLGQVANVAFGRWIHFNSNFMSVSDYMFTHTTSDRYKFDIILS